jgi:antitoxin ParD1/3/4/toxin ParE1/3/4
MTGYVLSPQARSDLYDIWEFIARDSVAAADRVAAEIHDAIGKLIEKPLLGNVREEFTDRPLRFYRVYSYYIIYRPDTSPLDIVRVMSGWRDVPAQLNELRD